VRKATEVQEQAPAAARGSFLGKAGPLVLARMFAAGLTVSIPLVLARAMDLAEYGTYKQLFLVAQTLYYVLPLGMAQSLYFFIPRAEQKRPYFGQTLGFLLSAGAVAAALLWILGEPVAHYFSNPALLEHRGALALFTLCTMGAFPLEASLTTQGRTRAAAICYVASDALRALAMVVPVLLGFGLRGMMVAVVGFALLRLVAAFTVVLGGSTGPFWDRRLFWGQLAYALPFGAAMLLAIPQQYAHQYAVSAAVTPELFALYAVGCFQLPVVDLLYTPTSEVLMVRLGELEKSGRLAEGAAAFREATAKLAFAFLPMAAFLFAAAPEFIGALFGQKFLPAVPMFRVSVVGVMLATLPMDGVLRARNQTRHIFLSYLVKALATAPLVFFGVRRFGMMGGIGAWAIAEVIGKLMLLSRIPRALSTPERRLGVRDVIPWKDMGKAMGAACAAGLAIVAMRALSAFARVALPSGSLWRVIPLFAAGLLFAVGYLVALRLTGIRPMSVLAGLRRPRST
jgi:O-antigen/teichoic acid export membrane protein